MWRYLKEAFWFHPALPGLGRFPANLAGLAGFLILGFGHEAFWLLGAGLETAYLVTLATNPRFQRLVRIQEKRANAEDDSSRQQALVNGLASDAHARLRRLEEQCERLARLRGAGEGTESTVDTNRQALQRIVWLFIKLLVAQQYLQSEDAKGEAPPTEAERRQLEEELARRDLSLSLRRSKEATLRIVTQRLQNVGRRARAVEEIASDLKRIEEQLKLALEEARLKGDSASVSFDVDLESDLLEDSFGAASGQVAALDRRYATNATATTPARDRQRTRG